MVAERQAASRLVADETVHLIDLALEEDRGSGDWTSRWTIPARTRATAQIVARAQGVVAGTAVAAAVFARLDPRVECSIEIADGGQIRPGDVLCSLKGPARALLTGERVALNFLQRLSGIATLTRRFVDAVAGTGVRILDTRKTTPGWRSLEKDAVRAGGGENHRLGLYDMILIKDNHVAIAGGVAEAIARVREQNNRKLPVEIEVRTIEELETAIDAGVDRVLLDNMDARMLRDAVKLARRRSKDITLEASGNVSLETVRDIASAGVDCISIGALTHSAPALDFSLRVERA
jgi:nicotinate-nucleotide pyrophosphorylase (carboxylating)